MFNGKRLDNNNFACDRYGIKHDNTIESHLLDILEKYIEDEDNVIFAVANSFVGSSFISENGNF